MKPSRSIISTELLKSEVDADFALDLEGQESRIFICGATEHGLRLDAALVRRVTEFSRSYLQQLIERGLAKINGQIVLKAACKVNAGDQISIVLQATPQSQAFKPEFVEFGVVYEDEHLLVINKPAGLVVHPAPGNWTGTLLNGLLYRDAMASLMPRAGIVHRLDKDTSGLMVVARTRHTMDALVKKIAERDVHRQYLALAHQPWLAAKHLDVEQAIGRDVRNRLRMAVVQLDLAAGKTAGKAAKTSFELLQNSEQACFIRCRLHTGRTHQIRVHMAFLGHPLLSDSVYGGVAAAGLTRQALHAEKLEFDHPITQEPLRFVAPLPADFQQALHLLGLSYNGATLKTSTSLAK